MELLLGVSNPVSHFLAKTCLISSRHETNSSFSNIIVDSKQKLFSNPKLWQSVESELVCKHCFTPWKDGKFRIRLIPKAPKKSIKKIMKRPPEARNSFESKLMSKWSGNSKNRLAKKCLVCNFYSYETLDKSFSHPLKEIKMEQTIVEHVEDEEQTLVEHVEDEPKKKKRKKKKKEKFAGLNPQAINSSRKNIEQSVQPKKSKRIETPVSKEKVTNNPIKESVKCEKKPKSVALASFEVSLTQPAEPIFSPRTTPKLIEEAGGSDFHPEMNLIFSSLSDLEKLDRKSEDTPKDTSDISNTVHVESLPQINSEDNKKLPLKANINSSITLPMTSSARERKKEKQLMKNNNLFILKSLKPMKRNKGKKKMKSHNKNLQALPKKSFLLKELLE